jgi:hypothetical protein
MHVTYITVYSFIFNHILPKSAFRFVSRGSCGEMHQKCQKIKESWNVGNKFTPNTKHAQNSTHLLSPWYVQCICFSWRSLLWCAPNQKQLSFKKWNGWTWLRIKAALLFLYICMYIYIYIFLFKGAVLRLLLKAVSFQKWKLWSTWKSRCIEDWRFPK